MKTHLKYLIFFFLAYSVKMSYCQISVSGIIDTLGKKQGIWITKLTSHELVPSNQNVWILENYKNDTLEGQYRITSIDSTFQYFFIMKKNKFNGYGYFLQNGKIRKTFYFYNENSCFVSEFDDKSRLFRTYILMNEKLDGDYLCFEKGKIVLKRYFKNGVMLNESINRINKKGKR